jgi:hypothetical protein
MARYEELEIDQGSDISVELHTNNIDGSAKNLTGMSVACKMKKTHRSSTSTDWACIVKTPANAGIIVMSLSNEQSDALKAGRYVYDVELSHSDSDGTLFVERILEGRITVNPSVTK